VKLKILIPLTKEEIKSFAEKELSSFLYSISVPHDGVLEVEPKLSPQELKELARKVAPFVPREISIALGPGLAIRQGQLQELN